MITKFGVTEKVKKVSEEELKTKTKCSDKGNTCKKENTQEPSK